MVRGCSKDQWYGLDAQEADEREGEDKGAYSGREPAAYKRSQEILEDQSNDLAHEESHRGGVSAPVGYQPFAIADSRSTCPQRAEAKYNMHINKS